MRILAITCKIKTYYNNLVIGAIFREFCLCHNKIYLNLLLGSVIFLQFSLIGPLTLLVTINWSPLHSLQNPCDLPQILPHPLQAINTDFSFILKTIIVTLSFTPVPWAPLLFYFWGLISGLQYIFFFTLFDCFNAFYFLFLFLNDLIAVCSHYSITPESNIKVIRIKGMTTN